ncbi:MAG: hypothetical protein J3K34DRAFT_49055 [Monoraphidium minutum]|nr:MAG: hypothetical protein J3K34DRAFT_49055 [Monoraphidium minutum]
MWRPAVVLGVLLLGACCPAWAGAPQQAPAAVSPFYTAMVNLSSVPTYRAPLKPAATGAPARRAAGFPAALSDSRPPLQRDFGAAFIGDAPRGAPLEGPATQPALPEFGRRLRQVSAAGALELPPPADAADADAAAETQPPAAAGDTVDAPLGVALAPEPAGGEPAAAAPAPGATPNAATMEQQPAVALDPAAPIPAEPQAQLAAAPVDAPAPELTAASAAGSRMAAAAAAAAAGCADGAACFTPKGGFPGLDAPPAGAMALAVGRRHILQVAGGVMSVFAIGPDGLRGATLRTVPLAAFFAGVAPSCTSVDDGAAIYDKHAGRFVVAASCGGYGRVLIATSATPSAAGTWFLFGLIADAVGTKLECRSPPEQGLVDSPRLGYNKDGLFVTYYSYCPSSPSTSGAVLLALPKFKAYQGAPSMYAAVYTAAEVAAAGNVPGGAAAVRQLQPVLPQSAEDVQEGVAYFVADHRPRSGAKRSSFTLAALINTGALWGFAAEINGVPSPTLLAAVLPWGQPAPIYSDAMLRQPAGGADLDAGGTSPVGFWVGGAALAHGKLMLTTRADATEDGGSYSPRPGVIWAEVAPQITYADASGSANGTMFAVPAAECPAAVSSNMESEFDWSKDFSQTWGSEFARNWSASLSLLRTASASKPRRAPRTSTKAAGVVLGRANALSKAAETSSAANFLAMAFPPRVAGGAPGSRFGGPNGGAGYRGRGGSCGCESSCGWGELQSYNYVYNFDDYCDAGYNQWGPESGNDMFGSTYNGAYCTGNAAFGIVGNNQYDQCGRWCSIRCPGPQGECRGGAVWAQRGRGKDVTGRNSRSLVQTRRISS